MHTIILARCRRLLCRLEDRVRAVLNKLQDLAISVPARQYRLLDAVMLPEQRRQRLVGSQQSLRVLAQELLHHVGRCHARFPAERRDAAPVAAQRSMTRS